MLKKFIVLTIKGKQRKTHAAKGEGKKNRTWCGCKFKRTFIKEKKELTIEYVTCQKCINTINSHVATLVEK